MNIIFEYNDKKLILPVNPESVKVTKPSQSQKVEVIGIGEVSVPQKRKLATVSISSFFWKDLFEQNFLLAGLGSITGYLPTSLTNSIGVSQSVNAVTGRIGNSFVRNTIAGIIDDSQKFTVLNEYVKWFEEWQASKTPARWTIVVPPNDPPQCFDFNVTCESFEYEVKAGEDGDYYYNIELLEWRDYGAKLLTAETKTDGTVQYKEQPKARLNVKAEIAQEVQTTDKDTIWSVSKKYCQDNWQDLFNESVNKAMLAASPQDLSGMTLKIPKKYLSGIISR